MKHTLRPPNIKTTSLLRPFFSSPKWYFPYDISFSLIRPLLGSPKGGLNIGILLYIKNENIYQKPLQQEMDSSK